MQCFVHFDLKMCFSPQRRAIFPQRNFKKWSETVSFLRFWLENVLLAIAACNFSTSQLQKVVRPWGVLYILSWKCASRHSSVQFFHIWTSKSGPRPSVFYDLDLKMCFSLQRRAIFPHRYFQKWSEHARNVCSLKEWHFTWKCASKSVPNMQCFVHFDLKMCFSPQRRPQNPKDVSPKPRPVPSVTLNPTLSPSVPISVPY